MLGVAEASERILARLGTCSSERVRLADALGRVLARDAVSAVALPPWPNSAMDGYAVRAEDVRGATSGRPVRLTVTESIAAGHFASGPVRKGEAARIMTGAPLPQGADTVVRVEDTDDGDSTVEIRSDRDAERNVRPRAEDVAEGDTVLRAHSTLGPSALAMLAAVGYAELDVTRKPRVAILGSGDELVPVEQFAEVKAGRRIVATNGYALAAIVREAGGEPIDLGIAPDDAAAIADRLRDFTDVDLIVTTGGISVGAHDHTRAVVGDLGTVDFWRVRMRPGAQTGFGDIGGVPWIGLPGNPVSALITGELFVRAAVLRLSGIRAVHRVPVAVRVVERVTSPGGMTHLLRVTVTLTDGKRTARLTGPQGSGILSSMARADALLVVPEDRRVVEAGETLAAIPLAPCEMADHLSLAVAR
jgi:molybdopterin molybdotransferase